MTREGINRERLRTSEQKPCRRAPDGESILVFPTARSSAGTHQSAQYLSDAEIAQLVSIALQDAIAALSEPNPESCILLRANEARVGIREALSAVPRGRGREPKVLEEYRRAMMFQNLVQDLALDLVGSIRRYAKVYEREIPPRSA